MEKAKGRKSAISPTLAKTSPASKFAREEVIERKIRKFSAEAIYFVIAFAVLALFVGLFGTVGVMAAQNRGTVPYYKTNSTLIGSKNVFNNGDQLGIGSVMYNFGNRNPLNSHKEQNGVLTIDGDIKLSKIRNVPIIKEDRLYNLNGDLWWNASKIGIWSGEVLPTSTPTTTFPSITTMGKVGIGTLDPKLQLHVRIGNAGGYPVFPTSSDMFLLEGRDYSIMHMLTNGNSGDGARGSYIEFATSTERGAGYIGYRNADDSIVFGHNGGINENMRITSDGRVGIGTAAPATKLHVNGDIVASPGSISATGAITANGNITSNSGNIMVNNGNIQASGDLSIRNINAAYINVPTVNTTELWSGTLNTGKLCLNGDCKTSWPGSSDSRLKKNIRPLTSSLDTIKKLDGVKFNWRKDEFPDRYFSAGDQLGFIAQDVEKVLPELVNTDTKGYKTLNYEGIIPVLVNAMKEQQQQIDELKAEVEKLKTDR